MNMKLLDVAKAYMELEKLADERLPIRISYGLDRAMEKIERVFHFYAQKEEELLNKYKPDERQGSILKYNDPDVALKYNEEHKELDELEEEVNIKPVIIPADTNIGVSWKGLRHLRILGIIKLTGFEGEDDE